VANPLIEDRVDELSREFGADGVEDALLTLLVRQRHGISELLRHLEEDGPLEDRAWLDVAALLATRRDALETGEGLVRDWLALFVLRERLLGSVEVAQDGVVDRVARFMSTQTELQREVIETVWKQPMLRPADVAAALGWQNAYRPKIRRYRQRSWLVGFLRAGSYHYLSFQFDTKRHEVFPEVRTINESLEAASDPWGVASWWISVNDRLDARPADLVGTDRTDDLLEAAVAELEPIG